MAFSYRNTLDSALNALPPKYSDQILATVGDKIKKRIDRSQNHFSYRTTPEVQELLAKEGIELAPISYQEHSHPACKMIENHILYKVLPNLLKNEYAIGLMSLREEKKNNFIKMRRFLKNGEFQAIKMFNSIIDGKDLFRYNDGVEFKDYRERVGHIRSEFAKPDFNARVMMVHDELHFHTPEEISYLFEEVDELRAIVCTFVCPVELLLGECKSKNPRIYSYEVSGDTLYFFPDGNPSEGYEQLVSNSVWPLKNSRIISPKVTLRITVLNSIFAHHVVVIERTEMSGKKKNFYKKPTCLLDNELSVLSKTLRGAQIERKTMHSILLYLSCLKSPNMESAVAKLRQLEKRELFEDEINLITNLSRTFSGLKCWDGLSMSLLKKVKETIYSNLPWLSSFIDEEAVWKVLFSNFSSEIQRKVVVVDLGVINLNESILDKLDRWIFERDLTVTTYSISEFNAESIVDLSTSWVDLINGTLRLPSDPSPHSEPLNNFVSNGFLIDYQEEIETIDHGIKADVALCHADMEVQPEGEFMPDYLRKNSCVFRSIAGLIGQNIDDLINFIGSTQCSEELLDRIISDEPLNMQHISEIAGLIGREIICEYDGCFLRFGIGQRVCLRLIDGHCTPADSKVANMMCRAEPNIMRVPAMGEIAWELDVKRAKNLIKSFLRGTTGVVGSSPGNFNSFLECSLKSIKLFDEKLSCGVKYIWGAPGSGKTNGLTKFIQNNPYVSAAVCSPRRLLSEEWFESIKNTNSFVTTYESFFERDTSRSNLIVVDEFSLLPPGFMDMLIVKIIVDRVRKPISGVTGHMSHERFFSVMAGVSIIVIGDPMQARYYTEKDTILLDKVHDIDIATLKGARRTIWRSFRMEKWFENVMDIPCLKSGGEPWRDYLFFSGISAVKGRKYDAILCASREDKSSLAGRFPVYTFGEAQGLSFDRVLIALSNHINLCSDHHVFVGLTRSRNQFDFIMLSEKTPDEFAKLNQRKLLGYVLTKKRIDRQRLAPLFGDTKVEFVNEINFGMNIEEKASNDLFILGEVNLCDLERVDEPSFDEVVTGDLNYKCHLPIASHDPLFATAFELMKAKEQREFLNFKTGWSEQFCDDDKKIKKPFAGYPFAFEAIFPRHSSTDDTTFWMAVKKRLTFSNTREELRKFKEARGEGHTFANIFLGSLPERFEVTDRDIEDGEYDFIEKRAAKPGPMWENHAQRSDVDWPIDQIFLFMKAQLCTKSEKMFSDAKAGQTISCFQHLVLFRFGPIIRAIEKAFHRACGKQFYIHSGKNFDDLNSFVLENGDLLSQKSLSIESDYEAFDASQDASILAFEYAVLKKIGVKQDFLDDYVVLKTTLGSKLGQLSIMRFSGEFSTFLFNTWSNMLFTFIKYDVRPKDRILFAGDDMATIGGIQERKEKKITSLLDNLKLKAKEDRRQNPMFCGWVLTAQGIYKKPSLLWARLRLMEEKGLLHTCIDNYLLELRLGYQMGENLLDYLDEFELECHYKSVRFFIEHGNMCRGESMKFLHAFGYTFGANWTSPKVCTTLDKEMVPGIGFMNQKLLWVQLEGMDTQSKKKSSTLLEILKVGSTVKGDDLKAYIPSTKEGKQTEPFLGHGDKYLKLLRCMNLKVIGAPESEKISSKEKLGVCQSLGSMTSAFGPIEKRLKSMQFPLQTYTKMLGFIQGRSSTALDVLSQTSKLLVGVLTKQSYLNFQSWTTMRFAGCIQNRANIIMYTLEQYSLASHRYFQGSKGLRERLVCSIVRCWTERWDTLHLMKSVLRRGLPFSASDRPTVCQLLILFCRKLLKLLWNSLNLTCRQAGRFLHWMSELCIDWPTQLVFSMEEEVMPYGANKKLGVPDCYRAPKEFVIGNQWMKRMGSKAWMSQLNAREGVYFSLLELQGSVHTELMEKEKERRRELWLENQKVNQVPELISLMDQFWGNLSLPRSGLINQNLEFTEGMSVQEIVRNETRARVARFLWVNFLDPNQAVIPAAHLPPLPGLPTGIYLDRYEAILSQFLPYFFGNIAIIGTSGKVRWPDVPVPIPNVASHVEGDEYNWTMQMNLSVICPLFENWRKHCGYVPLVTGTFRSMCEAFATEAMDFLKDRRQHGVFTAIYAKWPRAFDPAPWCAFDFAAGLNMHILTIEERMVIDRMTKRLFRTEGQKVVFSAQGEVNMHLEG